MATMSSFRSCLACDSKPMKGHVFGVPITSIDGPQDPCFGRRFWTDECRACVSRAFSPSFFVESGASQLEVHRQRTLALNTGKMWLGLWRHSFSCEMLFTLHKCQTGRCCEVKATNIFVFLKSSLHQFRMHMSYNWYKTLINEKRGKSAYVFSSNNLRL